MKRITLPLMTTLLSLFITQSIAQAQSILERFPQQHERVLSNGFRVDLPIHYYQSKGLILAGTGDLFTMNGILNEHGLEAMPILPGRGLVAIFMVEHQDTSIDRYHEFIITYAAQRRRSAPPRINRNFIRTFIELLGMRDLDRGPHQDEKGLYVQRIIVSSVEAQLAGIEIWNLPKDVGRFTSRFSGDAPTFSVDTPACTVHAALQRFRFRLPTLSVPMNVNLMSPGANRKLASTLVDGRGHFATTRWSDTFAARGMCKFELDDLSFRPKAWVYMQNAESVLFDLTVED